MAGGILVDLAVPGTGVFSKIIKLSRILHFIKLLLAKLKDLQNQNEESNSELLNIIQDHVPTLPYNISPII